MFHQPWGAPRAKWINFIGGRISGFTEGDHFDMVPVDTDRWSPPISVWRSGWAYNTQMTSIHLCEIITWRQGTTGSLNKHSNKNTTLLLVVSGIHPLHLWDSYWLGLQVPYTRVWLNVHKIECTGWFSGHKIERTGEGFRFDAESKRNDRCTRR